MSTQQAMSTEQAMTEEAKGMFSNVNAAVKNIGTGLQGVGKDLTQGANKLKGQAQAGLSKANAVAGQVQDGVKKGIDAVKADKPGAVKDDAYASAVNGIQQVKEEGKKALSKAKQAMKDAKEFAINVEKVRKQVANSSGQEKKNLQGQLRRKEIELKKNKKQLNVLVVQIGKEEKEPDVKEEEEVENLEKKEEVENLEEVEEKKEKVKNLEERKEELEDVVKYFCAFLA